MHFRHKKNNILTPAPGIHFSAVGWSKCHINVSLSVRQENVLVLDRLQSAGKSLAGEKRLNIKLRFVFAVLPTQCVTSGCLIGSFKRKFGGKAHYRSLQRATAGIRLIW